MLLAKHPIRLVPLFLLNFHAVVVAPGAFNVECNLAAGGLALHAGSIPLQADDALQQKSLLIELVQSHRCLGRYYGPRDPRSTAQVNPLVETLGRGMRLQGVRILVQEELIVLWGLSHFLIRIKLKFQMLELSILLLGKLAHVRLEVVLSVDDHIQTKILVFILTQVYSLSIYQALALEPTQAFISVGDSFALSMN